MHSRVPRRELSDLALMEPQTSENLVSAGWFFDRHNFAAQVQDLLKERTVSLSVGIEPSALVD